MTEDIGVVALPEIQDPMAVLVRNERAVCRRDARGEGLEQPDGVSVPERTAVFTVRLAPSLIGGLRERAGASGQTLSAVTAEAVHAYLADAGGRGGGQAP